MKKTSKIIWQDEAVAHLKEIRRYISKDSKIAAKNVARKIKNSVDRLANHSFIGQEEGSLRNLAKEDRYLVMGSYKVIYRVKNHTIYILAVFDTRRNPQSIENEISKEI